MQAVSALFFQRSRFPRTLSLACGIIRSYTMGTDPAFRSRSFCKVFSSCGDYVPRDAEHGDEGPVKRPEFITSRVAKEGRPKDAVCMQMLVRVTST